VGRRVSTQRVDDIDGSTAAQTVAFTIDHRRFEIDLSDANAAALRAVFAPYIAAGREAHPGRNAAQQNGAQNNGAPKSASKKSVSRKSADQKSGPHNIAAPQKKPAPEKPARARTEPQRFTSSSSTARSGGKSSPRTPSTARTASPIPEERTGAQTPPTRAPDDKPDASVVPLQRRASAAAEVDVAAQRRRLTAGIGELLRVLAVATVTRATNRVVSVIAKPKRVRCP
jgi:hypothetical protein